MFVAFIAIQIPRMDRSSLHKVAERSAPQYTELDYIKRLPRLDGFDLTPVEPLPVKRG